MSDTPSLPEQIGPYRVERLLGEGAMGRVVLARQAQPERAVALKLLSGAAAGADVRARFAREARLLALLEHPNIARLYAADVADTPLGQQPWLAMEYVPGADLLQHARGLPLRERIALLATVCKAVHFAHTRGVIHRDLKPANLLVDAHGQPKVLDFGIAHVVGADDHTSLTRAGEVLGTLPYMSWEQLGGEAAALDPRSDVFALGVIGYELVAGTRPYPSLATPSLTAVLEQRRRNAPQRLSQHAPEARGDLETILHKAMAFEARDRYDSAADLAGDLQRWLDHRPIEARPPTATYVMSRFVRRHRALSAALAVALLSLVAASVVSTRYALAEREARESETAARAQAEARVGELRAVNQFLEDTLSTADPANTKPGNARTLAEFLDSTEKTLAADRSVPPMVAAQVLKTLGSIRHGMEQYDRAAALLDEASAKLQAAPPDDAARPLLAQEIKGLRGVVASAKGDVEGGKKLLQEALQALPPSTGEAQRLRMVIYGRYADLLLGFADYPGVVALLKDIAAESERTLGPDDNYTLFNQARLAYAYRLSGDQKAAIAELASVVPRVQKVFGPDNSLTLMMMNEQALNLMQTERGAEAEPIFRTVLAADERLYGPDSQSTVAVRSNLINTLIQLKKWDEATSLSASAWERAKAALGPGSVDALMTSRTYARTLEQAGRAKEAEALYLAAIAGLPKVMGPKNPEVFRSRNEHAVFLIEQKRVPEALAIYRQLYPEAIQVFGEGNGNVVAWGGNYGRAMLESGDHAGAKRMLESVLPGLVATFGEDNPRVQKARERLAQAEAALASGAAP